MLVEARHLPGRTVDCRSVVKEERISIEGVGEVHYALYTSDGSVCQRYGTTCEMIYCLGITLNRKGGEGETCELLDIARDRHAALRLFTLLVSGRVTPCTAEEILQELLQIL